MEEKTDNPLIRIYVNKIENRIPFKIKTGYYLQLLTLEMMKVLGSNKSKITKDKNGKNVHNLEMNKVVLVHFNIVNNPYQRDSGVLHTSIPKKSFGQLLDIFANFYKHLIQNFHIFKYGLLIKILNR